MNDNQQENKFTGETQEECSVCHRFGFDHEVSKLYQSDISNHYRCLCDECATQHEFVIISEVLTPAEWAALDALVTAQPFKGFAGFVERTDRGADGRMFRHLTLPLAICTDDNGGQAVLYKVDAEGTDFTHLCYLSEPKPLTSIIPEDTFIHGYLQVALLMGFNEAGADSYWQKKITDFTQETVNDAQADCLRFQKENEADLARWCNDVGEEAIGTGTPGAIAGQCFYVSRNGDNAFIEREGGETPAGKALDEAAAKYKPKKIHKLDNGQLTFINWSGL